MKICIIAAMNKEVDLLLLQMKDYAERRVSDFTVYEGSIGDKDVTVAQCGIGKVNAALRTMAVISECRPDMIINSGVAGGTDASMHIADVLVVDRVAYHDVWCGPGTVTGAADGCPLYFTSDTKALHMMDEIAREEGGENIRFGLLCSGDRFISKPEEVAKIKSDFPDALGCDMESAAIAQTCYKAGIPFIIVRVMSDMPGGGDNISEYTNFWGEAPSRTFETVSKLIGRL